MYLCFTCGIPTKNEHEPSSTCQPLELFIGHAKIIDLIRITKWAVLGWGNLSYRRGKNGRKAGDTIRKFSDQKVLI
jgi:hypothetical protein